MLLESREGQRASIGQTSDSSGDTLIQETSPNTCPSTPMVHQYPDERSESGTKAGSVANSLDIGVTNGLCRIVSAVLRIQDLEATVYGWRLETKLTDFFTERADRAQDKPPPNPEAIVDICCRIIRDKTWSTDNKVIKIVKEVVELFKGAGWSLSMQQDDEDSYIGSIVYPDDTSMSQADSRGHQGSTAPYMRRDKRPRGDSGSSPTPYLKPQKRLSAAPSSAGPSSSRAQDRGSVSLSSPGPIKCCEPGCENRDPLSNIKTFRVHYQTHFPPKVATCPWTSNGHSCPHRSNRPDNFKNHLEQHAMKFTPLYHQLVNELRGRIHSIRDVFHTVCPFCPKLHRLRNVKSSEDHIIDHYENGSATSQTFLHRCAKQCHRWECSLDIPEDWRDPEVNPVELDTEDSGTNDRCPSENDSDNEGGRSRQFLCPSGAMAKGKRIQKDASPNGGSGGNQGYHGSGGNKQNPAGNCDHLSMRDEASPVDILPHDKIAEEDNASILKTHATELTAKEATRLSVKAQNGSSKGRRYAHSPASRRHTHSTLKSKESGQANVVERLVTYERDHRSYAVKEFDAHQEEARRRHQDELINVVGKGYV